MSRGRELAAGVYLGPLFFPAGTREGDMPDGVAAKIRNPQAWKTEPAGTADEAPAGDDADDDQGDKPGDDGETTDAPPQAETAAAAKSAPAKKAASKTTAKKATPSK
jgi:hypothetical protein